jgi:spermidine dehydrogenase
LFEAAFIHHDVLVRADILKRSHADPRVWELPDAQKEGLRNGVKVPFVYANVLLDNGRAFSKLGASRVSCPLDPFLMVGSAPPTTTGGFELPRGPDDPMMVLMMASPTPAPKGPAKARDLLRLGRHDIYTTSFATYERQIRDQLQALLGEHGFDHETDIRAITVNRIPHGYSYSYLALDDPEWDEGQAPHEIGRAQFGRISIANTDSEAAPIIDAAIDAA